MFADTLDLGRGLQCEQQKHQGWRSFCVPTLQRSSTLGTVWESVSDSHRRTIKRAEVAGREMSKMEKTEMIKTRRTKAERRRGMSLLSKPQEWKCSFEQSTGRKLETDAGAAALKGCSPLRLKPHCFSSTRWYFLLVGVLGWSTGEGEGLAKQRCSWLSAAHANTAAPLAVPGKRRQECFKGKVWRLGPGGVEGCTGPRSQSVNWNEMQVKFFLLQAGRLNSVALDEKLLLQKVLDLLHGQERSDSCQNEWKACSLNWIKLPLSV